VSSCEAKKKEETQKFKIQNRFISQGKFSNYCFLQKVELKTKKINTEVTYKSHKSAKQNYSDNGLDGVCSLLDF
jgi:hypothetical protein